MWVSVNYSHMSSSDIKNIVVGTSGSNVNSKIFDKSDFCGRQSLRGCDPVHPLASGICLVPSDRSGWCQEHQPSRTTLWFLLSSPTWLLKGNAHEIDYRNSAVLHRPWQFPHAQSQLPSRDRHHGIAGQRWADQLHGQVPGTRLGDRRWVGTGNQRLINGTTDICQASRSMSDAGEEQPARKVLRPGRRFP